MAIKRTRTGGKSTGEKSSAAPPEVVAAEVVDDPALIPTWIDEATLKLDPDNVNTHDKFNVDVIASSLKRFGQRTPIVVQAGTMIVKKGNGTLLAFRQCCEQIRVDPSVVTRENWDKRFGLQCIARKIAVVDAPLDNVNADGYAIVDNQSGRTSAFDYKKLGAKLRSLRDADFDLALTGFKDFELKPLIASGEGYTPPPVDQTYQPTTQPDSAGEKNKLVSFTPAQWRDVEIAIAVLIHRGHVGDEMNDAAALVVLSAQFLERNVSESEREQARRLIGNNEGNRI